MKNCSVPDTHVHFIQPHFIEELGEEGLTAHEIAQSLGVEIADVLRKIKRNKWNSGIINNFNVMSYGYTNPINNRNVVSYYLNTNAAKVFVARWSNKIGDGYLMFLFRCEEVVKKVVPEILKALEETKERLKAMEQEALRNKRKIKSGAKSGMIMSPTYFRDGIFELLQIKWEMKQKETLDELSLLKAKMRHSQKTSKGLAEKIILLQDMIENTEIKEVNKLSIIKKNIS
jgi:hypothetical protein